MRCCVLTCVAVFCYALAHGLYIHAIVDDLQHTVARSKYLRCTLESGTATKMQRSVQAGRQAAGVQAGSHAGRRHLLRRTVQCGRDNRQLLYRRLAQAARAQHLHQRGQSATNRQELGRDGN